MNNRNKIIIAVFAVFTLILAIIGTTYAWYSVAHNGIQNNTITSGTITFHYDEKSQGLSVQDAMPMTDLEGMAQNSYFEFDITSKTSNTVDIPYYITVRRSGTGTNMDDLVKIYLTKVNNGIENPVLLTTGSQISTFDDLNSYRNNAINIPENEKELYTDSVLAGDSDYKETYRLRMWISEEADFSDGDYNNKTYTLKVNVYGEGNEVIPNVTITNKGKTQLTMDETLTLLASKRLINDNITWSSSDSTKATVSNGVVTPISAGDVTITASAGTQSDSISLKIIDIGSIISIGSEDFYYIGKSGTDWLLLAKYNLNIGENQAVGDVGIQNSNCLGINSAGITPYPCLIAFDTNDSNVYSSSSIKEYVDSYVDTLKQTNSKVKSGRLLTQTDLENLINDGVAFTQDSFSLNSGSNYTGKEWLSATSYWLDKPLGETVGKMIIAPANQVAYTGVTHNASSGLRPVIILES